MTSTRFETMELATAAAIELTNSTGAEHIAYKTSYACDPFVAGRLPQIGDKVSMGFNGDYYPEGEIVKIHKNHKRVITSTGREFTRVGDMRWKQGGKNGAFSMIEGHISKMNPHF